MWQLQSTYAVGELFDAAGPLGLPLPDLCACRFGVPEADTRVSRGEELDAGGAEGAMSTYEFRSWGAGDGAIAMAALMMMCYGEGWRGQASSGTSSTSLRDPRVIPCDWRTAGSYSRKLRGCFIEEEIYRLSCKAR